MDTHTDPEETRRAEERARAARRVERARQTAPRLGYSIDESAVALGVSRRVVHDLIAEDRLKSVKIGARRVIPRSELERLLTEGTADPEPTAAEHEISATHSGEDKPDSRRARAPRKARRS